MISSAAPKAAAGIQPDVQLPLVFEPNRGQADPRARFVARAAGSTLLLEDEGAVLRLASGEIRMTLAGARPGISPEALDPLPGTSSYFIGDDAANWRTAIPQYGRVRYQYVYPGVDLVFHAATRRFEYDFVVAPGADPSAIGVRMEGADSIAPDGDGGLVLRTGADTIRQPRPRIYQDIATGRKEIPGRMVFTKGDIIRFRLGRYDRTRPLIIDPVMTNYLAGSGNDSFGGIAMDSTGNVYVTGSTTSSDFPKSAGLGPVAATGGHVFVTKISPDLKTLIYSVIVGGSLQDSGNAITLDAAGNAYVTGETKSQDFPRVNAAQNFFGFKRILPITDGEDAFVLKLDAKGSALMYSTYLGGDGRDRGISIAVDKTGAAYITGNAGSRSFPVTSTALNVFHDAESIFVAKLSPDGATFLYVALFGGSTVSNATAIAIDATGNAYVAGFVLVENQLAGGGSAPGPSDFPTTPGVYQRARPGANCPACASGVVAKLNAAGSSLIFATYFGGNFSDAIYDLSLDASGNIYVAGITDSPDLPVSSGALGLHHSQNPDNGFAAALNNSGTAVVACTYLGGSGAYGILVRSPAAIGIIGASNGDFVGLTASTSHAGAVYLETDPLFQKALNIYAASLSLKFSGLAAAPDGSVALGASTPVIPTAGGFVIGNHTIVLVTKIPSPTAAPPPPVLSLSAAASANSVAAGSDFTYSFTVKNAGPGDAANLKLSATLSGNGVQLIGATLAGGICPTPRLRPPRFPARPPRSPRALPRC